jgi:Rab family protein
VEFATKNVELRNGAGIVKAQIWDTGKHTSFSNGNLGFYKNSHSWTGKVQGHHICVRRIFRIICAFSHYRRAVGALVVYDVTKEETFTNARRWMEELRGSAEPDCVIFLVGNQVDRVELNPQLRQVPTEKARAFAADHGLKFEETSALTNARVSDVFDTLLHSKYSRKKY